MRFLGHMMICLTFLLTQSHVLLASELTISLTEKNDLVGVDRWYKPQQSASEQPEELEQKDEKSDERPLLEDTIVSYVKKADNHLGDDSTPLIPKNPLDDVSYHVYMENLDTLLDSPSEVGLGQCPRCSPLLIDTLGFIPVIPATGVIRKTTRDLIGAAQGTTMGNIAIAATVLLLTPSYIGQFAKRRRLLAQDLRNCCAVQRSHSSLSGLTRYSGPILTPEQHLMISTSRAHKILKGLLFVGTVVNSSARVVQMIQLYLDGVSLSDRSQALGWVGGLGPFYFGAEIEANYKNGEEEIRRFFDKWQSTKENRAIKDLLVARVRYMKQAIATCTDEHKIRTRYEIVTGQQVGPDSLRKYWKSSFLLVKRLEELPHDNPSASWENFVRDTALFGKDSPYRAAADWVAKGFIFAGTWGRYEVLYYTLNMAFVWMGADVQVASGVSATVAGIAVLTRIPCESNLHHHRAREIFLCAPQDTSPDGPLTQKLIKVEALGGAALFALSNFALGLEACAHYPTLGQVILIGSAVVLDLSAYYGWMKQHIETFFRPLVTPCRSTMAQMKTFLIMKCNQLENNIDRLQNNVTSVVRYLFSC